jgi:hypothetical protein
MTDEEKALHLAETEAADLRGAALTEAMAHDGLGLLA